MARNSCGVAVHGLNGPIHVPCGCRRSESILHGKYQNRTRANRDHSGLNGTCKLIKTLHPSRGFFVLQIIDMSGTNNGNALQMQISMNVHFIFCLLSGWIYKVTNRDVTGSILSMQTHTE